MVCVPAEVRLRRYGVLPLLFAFALGCRNSGAAPPPSTVRSTGVAIPSAWAPLNLPSQGILAVSLDTDEHGFYADYRGSDKQALLEEVSRRLVAAGYAQSCTAEDGYVLGFSKGDRQLAVKVDAVPVLVLSVFDARGKEPLLHGLCFGRYHAGPWHTLEAREKAGFVRQLESNESGARPTLPPSGASSGPSATSTMPPRRHP